MFDVSPKITPADILPEVYGSTDLFHSLPYKLQQKIEINKENGCWEWLGCIIASGYGIISLKNEEWRIHRLVWTLLVDEIPDGLVIDHICRNRKCCNPEHLRHVTHRENILENSNAEVIGISRSPEYNSIFLPYLYKKDRPKKFKFYQIL